ncbi:unnamed protein product, partial [Amoebophrya sp. A25]
ELLSSRDSTSLALNLEGRRPSKAQFQDSQYLSTCTDPEDIAALKNLLLTSMDTS